jgi:hypothetical protein
MIRQTWPWQPQPDFGAALPTFSRPSVLLFFFGRFCSQPLFEVGCRRLNAVACSQVHLACHLRPWLTILTSNSSHPPTEKSRSDFTKFLGGLAPGAGPPSPRQRTHGGRLSASTAKSRSATPTVEVAGAPKIMVVVPVVGRERLGIQPAGRNPDRASKGGF